MVQLPGLARCLPALTRNLVPGSTGTYVAPQDVGNISTPALEAIIMYAKQRMVILGAKKCDCPSST